HRHAPRQMLDPARAVLVGRALDEVGVRHVGVRHSRRAVGPPPVLGETELGFLRPHLGYGNETVLGEARGPVDEGHVHLVRRVLHPVEEVARPDDDVGYFEHALIFHFGEARQWWWVTL